MSRKESLCACTMYVFLCKCMYVSTTYIHITTQKSLSLSSLFFTCVRIYVNKYEVNKNKQKSILDTNIQLTKRNKKHPQTLLYVINTYYE